MFDGEKIMYTEPGIWIAIVLAGIAGCAMTAIFANSLKDIPVGVIAGNWKKHLWSIIFAIPIPFLLGLGDAAGVFLAFMWLMLAPTIASKLYFGPKQVPAMTLNGFHSGYALAALTVFVLITRYMTIAGS